eukprot:728124-Pelagomonas_calceolata.AAC.1
MHVESRLCLCPTACSLPPAGHWHLSLPPHWLSPFVMILLPVGSLQLAIMLAIGIYHGLRTGHQHSY